MITISFTSISNELEVIHEVECSLRLAIYPEHNRGEPNLRIVDSALEDEPMFPRLELYIKLDVHLIVVSTVHHLAALDELAMHSCDIACGFVEQY